jgi:hypothetical protein
MVKTLREVKTFATVVAKAEIETTPLGKLHAALKSHSAVGMYLEQKQNEKQLRLANK